MKLTRFLSFTAAIASITLLLSACGSEDKELENSKFWHDTKPLADNPLDQPTPGNGEFDPNALGNNDFDPNKPGQFGELEAEGDEYLKGFGSRLKNAPDCAPIYFEVDLFEVSPMEAAKIEAVVAFLNDHEGTGVVVEGNCDDRGTKVYNRGLGERRAQSVKAVLLEKGIPEKRIATISYGEDKPAVTGDGEIVWAKNRRADFVLVKLTNP